MTTYNHIWVRSTLGHGDVVCQLCKVTNLEAGALGIINHCEIAKRIAEEGPGAVREISGQQTFDAIQGHWQKIVALMMYTLGITDMKITNKDIQLMGADPEGANIVLRVKEDHLEIRLLDDKGMDALLRSGESGICVRRVE